MNSTALTELTGLTPLMLLTMGRPEITIGLLDGPVAGSDPYLSQARIRGSGGVGCSYMNDSACMHATFIARLLVAERDAPAPGICPGCTVLVRPIFSASGPAYTSPSATSRQVAATIINAVDSGARVLNLSSSFDFPSGRSEYLLDESLDYAASRGSIVVAAAGNQGTVGSSAITRHPWVIPTTACDTEGNAGAFSNLGHSIGRRGLRAPGTTETHGGESGAPVGTSVAVPFVVGAVALLWSVFPAASASAIRRAITLPDVRRSSIVPPLLDAWCAYRAMARMKGLVSSK
jgi:subtilisin family serine protease